MVSKSDLVEAALSLADSAGVEASVADFKRIDSLNTWLQQTLFPRLLRNLVLIASGMARQVAFAFETGNPFGIAVF